MAIVADAISTTIPILDGLHAITFEDTAIPESGAVVLIGLGLGLLRRRMSQALRRFDGRVAGTQLELTVRRL